MFQLYMEETGILKRQEIVHYLFTTKKYFLTISTKILSILFIIILIKLCNDFK